MKFLKWLLLTILFVIIAAAVAAYIFLKNFDLNKYKQMAENMVYEQTGRKLTIAGDASLGISLIPTIVINDVSFANPEWAKNPQMVKVSELELRFSIIPLFSKQIVIDKAVLKQPQIYLETAKDGQNSWDIKFASAEKKTSSAGWLIKNANAAENSSALNQLKDFVAKEVLIENGIINYLKHKDNSLTNVKINHITFNTDGMTSPMNADWDVVFNDMELIGKGTFGSLAALLSGTEEYPANVDMKALGISAVANAKIKNLMNDKLSATFDYNVYNPAGNMNAPETTLIGIGNATLSKVNLDISKLNIINNTLKGKVSADISGAKPYVTADLSGTTFNLGDFKTNKPTAFNFELINSANATAYVPNDKIPFDLLKSANAKATLTLKKLIVDDNLTLTDLALKAALVNGTMTIKPLDFKIGKGSINLTSVINANNKSISLQGTSKDVLITDVAKQLQVADQKSFGFISGGNTQTYFNVNGTGDTYRALVDNLNGQVIAVVEPSKLQSGQLKFLTNSFITQLLQVLNIDTSKTENVDLKCAVVRADIKDGVATFPKGIAVNSDKLDLVSNGTINLRKDKLNLSVNAYRSGIAKVSLVQTMTNLFKISGTLQSPSIAIDQNGAIKTIAGAALSGGTLTGAQMLLDKDTAPCYTALQNTIFKDKFAKPTGVTNAAQKTYQGTSATVDDGLNMVRDSAKEIKNIGKGLINNILKQ